MEQRHHTLIEASDGRDVNLMGYFHASVRNTFAGPHPFVEPNVIVEELTQPTPPPERWWQAMWRILNTDIFELWRTYGPKGSRPS